MFLNLEISLKMLLTQVSVVLLCHGIVVITTAQLHSTKPELRFCTGSSPACSMSGIQDSEDLWQPSQLEIRLNVFGWSTVPQSNSSSSSSSSSRKGIFESKESLPKFPINTFVLTFHLKMKRVFNCVFIYGNRTKNWDKKCAKFIS